MRKLNKRPNISKADIRLVVYDFDGVLTDNKVLVFSDGKEAVFCNRADGWAINQIKKFGIPQVIFSTETNKIVMVRARKLGLPARIAIKDKKSELISFCKNKDIGLKNVLYIGNDTNDLEAMKLTGYPIAPADAHKDIKGIAKYILKTEGGRGVARELYDILFR